MNHVLCGLAANAALPSELVDRLIAVADTDIAADLAGRADLSHAQAIALVSRVEESAGRLAYEGRLTATDIDPAAQPHAALALLHEGVGRPEWARLLAADPVAVHREKLAACPSLPSDVVKSLAADPDVRVVAELALYAAPDMAARLAQHPHAEVRRAVAANEATPSAVLAALISGEGLAPARRCLVCDREKTPFVHDPECARLDCDLLPGASCDGSHESTMHDMQHAALRNPATPTEAVIGFAGHPSTLLRWALAARPDLPSEVCGRLAVDGTPGVRADLAENPAIDEALIRVLAGDQGHEVRRRLAHNPHVPLDVLTDLADTAKIGATLLPRIAAAAPMEVEELAKSPNPAVRMLLAQRRDLPTEIRDALATDPDAKVVKSIAGHPGLSEARLRTMVDRHGSRVLAKVAANPDTAPALLEDLAQHQPPVQKALREVARHRNATAPALLACLADKRARPIAAGHPALPPPVIVDLLTDTDWRVVEAAAANPSLPPAVMSDLVPRP
ncbi:uncharacterized protein YneF (UPF0154 family) [Streptomyces umbrinus]|uniref:Uncharacterized protein YneF (UPF0154 family) n=1 Tax=Streptomyces umbrinus TaxID=67370 RepID=A0ABU0SI92_9ACTN|nr:hypothetical protein [Streptomyces umbrinus]MDQ1023286.1 uncharacterized protein YneF (UPF0154 family) [Streptomyces umbrinus]